MKISARNVFEGQITAVVPGPVNTEVALILAGGDQLVAVVTQASARNLGLTVGGAHSRSSRHLGSWSPPGTAA
jgi:molybdate transport system regulatory protein